MPKENLKPLRDLLALMQDATVDYFCFEITRNAELPEFTVTIADITAECSAKSKDEMGAIEEALRQWREART